MMNTLEDRIMVNPINDSGKMKPIDSDSRLKAKQEMAKDEPHDINPATSQDSVSLSGTSKQLEMLKASLRDVPEINAARVLYFKAEIESGKYQIDSSKIAKNMLNNTETA